tara:strand:+ start:2928 stop:4280 length:1353 start_codon:yes stop_codon:yes gene_type:complete
MSKLTKYSAIVLITVLLLECSFDNKTGIWSGSENEKKRISELEKKQRQKIDVVNIYSYGNEFTQEIKASKASALTEPKKNSSWKMSGLNLQNHLGNIYLPKIDNNFLKKKIGKDKFNISQVVTPPIIYNNNIFFSDDVGTIYSVNLRGKINWKQNIYKKIYNKIYKNLTYSVYKDKIYIADNIGFIYAINLNSGKLAWVKNLRVPLKSNIKIYEDKIFLVNQDNRLLCLNTEKGIKLWDIRSIKSFIKSQYLLAMSISKQGDLVVLNSSNDLVKIQAKSGRIYWSVNIIDAISTYESDFFKSSDIVIADTDIIFSTSSSIFSYNLNTGYRNWVEKIGSKNIPIVNGDNIFSITDNGFLVNLDRKSGKINWSTNLLKSLKKRKQETKISGFVMGSGKIYSVTSNGYLIVSSASSGQVEKLKKMGDPVETSPIISDGSLFVLTSNSKILGFN